MKIKQRAQSNQIITYSFLISVVSIVTLHGDLSVYVVGI